MIVPVFARGGLREAVPGARGLVRFEEDPGWSHERLFLWQLGAERWLIYTPDGDLYDEDLADYESVRLMTGRTRYPGGAGQVVAFSRPLERQEVLGLVKRARAEAAGFGGPPDPGQVVRGVDWGGGALEVPALLAVEAPRVRRRLVRKTAGPGQQIVPAGGAAPPTAAPPTAAPTVASEDSLVAGSGNMWLVSDLAPAGDFEFGMAVTLTTDSLVKGTKGILVGHGGELVSVERVAATELESWRSKKRLASVKLFSPSVDLDGGLFSPADVVPAVTPPGAAPPEPVGSEDLRTCWIDYDEAGTRYKEWRKVIQESTQEHFSDSSLLGPPTCLSVCRKMQRHGGNPKMWFQEWAKEIGLGRKDRAWHEVNSLIELLYVAGTFDQLNMGANACLEVATRRLLQYVEAYAHGADHPNWSSAKHFAGTSSALDLVPDVMRSYASRLSKEEAELENLRSKARAPGAAAGTAGAGAAAAAAALAGGLPEAGGETNGGGGGAGRRGRGGRGRGSRPPPT